MRRILLFTLLTIGMGLMAHAACDGDHTPGKLFFVSYVSPSGYYRFCTVCHERIELIEMRSGKGTFVEGGRTWEFEPKSEGLSICGVTPAGGDLVVPSSYKGVPVTEVGCFFRRYEHYDSLTIPEGVVSIEANSFYSSALNKVKFPSTLKSIGDYAFCGTNLTDVEIPASVEEIGYAAFGASDVTNFVVSSENPYFFGKGGSLYSRNPQTLICGDHVDDCVIEDGTEVMQGDLFYYSNTAFLSIPGSVYAVDPSAFTQTPHLTVVELRNGVISCDLSMLNNRSRWVENGAFIWRYVPTLKICRSVTDIASDMSILKHIQYVLYEEGDGERVKEMVERAGLDTTNVQFAPYTKRTIPQTWADGISGFLDQYGYDASLTASLPTGKIGLDGKAMTVWDDYVAGTNPVDETSRFTVKIEFDSGKPVVKYEPDLGEKRVYTLYGSADLKSWVPAGEDLTPYKFFKVSVDLPE